tara:strand:+ start:417 stop:1112 length:696 start_codon:yes stop_codon:yes gene_type:complete
MFNLGTKTKLVIFDMAGTIINEKGIIYKSIDNTLQKIGIETYDKHLWPGRDKKEILHEQIKMHYSKQSKNTDKKSINNLVDDAEEYLLDNLFDEYFNGNNIQLFPNTIPLFNDLRMNNIKIGLNTGYPKCLQEKIIDGLKLHNHIDVYTSSSEFKHGRPYPYMIYDLMEKSGVSNFDEVIKVGDTKNDILEGINAGCGKSIGVLTGAGKKEELQKFTKYIVEDISDVSRFI